MSPHFIFGEFAGFSHGLRSDCECATKSPGALLMCSVPSTARREATCSRATSWAISEAAVSDADPIPIRVAGASCPHRLAHCLANEHEIVEDKVDRPDSARTLQNFRVPRIGQ
jgi:hypothetical protein